MFVPLKILTIWQAEVKSEIAMDRFRPSKQSEKKLSPPRREVHKPGGSRRQEVYKFSYEKGAGNLIDNSVPSSYELLDFVKVEGEVVRCTWSPK